MEKDRLSVNDNVICPSGTLDSSLAEAAVQAMTDDKISYILDFKDVTDVNFAAQRTLLRHAQGGGNFFIMNAADEVARKFEDTGVASFVNVCRKPQPLDLSGFREFGQSYMSKAYKSTDGDSIMKVYGPRVPMYAVVQEKITARAVMAFGINTPMVGTLYEKDGYTGLDFERIEGKRSFSRIISEEPGRLEELSRRFAVMCKELHSTECDTSIFQDRRYAYAGIVKGSSELTDEEKAVALRFIDGIPAATTCLHGDMQPSNVITNGVDYLWIDLGEFGYGNPLLDMGMWYFLTHLNSDRISIDLFHLDIATMGKIYDYFIEEYYGADTDEKKARINASIEPYAALHMLYIGTKYGFEPGMMDYIRVKLLSV